MGKISDQIGRRIRQLRKENDLTQEMLSWNAGITVSFLGDIERGKKQPSIESLEKLLFALGITFQEFFSFEIDYKIQSDTAALDAVYTVLKNRPNHEVKMIYDICKRIILHNDGR